MENNTFASAAVPASKNWKPYAVGGALIAMLGANAALFVRGNNLDGQLEHLRANTSAEISDLRSANGNQAESTKKTVAEMTAWLDQYVK